MTRAILAVISAVLLSAMSPTHAATDQPISLSTPAGELHGSLMLPGESKAQTVALIMQARARRIATATVQ